MDHATVLDCEISPFHLDLPEEPMNAFTLHKLAEFKKKDSRIQRQTFYRDKKMRYVDLARCFPMRMPEGILTREIPEYLKWEHKAPGDELHLLAFAIEQPLNQQLYPVGALRKWVIQNGVFIPAEISHKSGASEVFFPCIGGHLTIRELKGYELTEIWNTNIQIIVYDTQE